MEIQYKRAFTSKDGKYTAGEINLMLGRAMEIYEMRPALTEGKLGIGEICVLLFGLTPEEYAQKDTDVRAFDALADSLRKNVPADRLMGVRVVDLKGAAVKREIKVKTGESIDNGAFASRIRSRSAGPIDAALLECAKVQKLGKAKDAPEGVKEDWRQARQRLGQALLQTEKLIVADDAMTAGRFPSVGFDGRIELFTTMERAARAKQQFCAANGNLEIWTLREIPRAEYAAFFRRCTELGMPAFRVDNGFTATELNLNDFQTGILPENASLRGNIVREIEFGSRWQRLKELNAAEPILRGTLEGMLTFRNFVWREIGNTVLYAACVVSGTDGAALCTQSARAKLDPEQKCRIVPADKFMIVTDKTGKRLMPVFTSGILAAAFAEKREENAEPVAMTFDDLKARMSLCDGIVIDLESLGYRVLKEQADSVLDLRGKPPMVVKIQPPQPEKKEEAPKPNADLGGLPDPDADSSAPQAAVPASTEAAEPAAEPASAENDKPTEESAAVEDVKPAETPAKEKKSIFRKLFGKAD